MDVQQQNYTPYYYQDELYNAIAGAETGSSKDPWIRTNYAPKGGSTAFGPVQITKTKAEDYASRGLLSPESIAFVREVLNPMYDQFNKYGKEEKRPGYSREYDYGGTGNFDVEKYRGAYEKLAKEMMLHDYNANRGDIPNTVKAWRSTGNDARYNQSVYKALGPR